MKASVEQTEQNAAALQEQLQNADAAAAGLRSALSSGMLLANNIPSALADQRGDVSAAGEVGGRDVRPAAGYVPVSEPTCTREQPPSPP